MGIQTLFHRLFAPEPIIDGDTFILWEPCSSSHAEVVPGYAEYLLELGYKVLVMMTPARLDEGLFERMSHPNLTLSRMSQRQIRRFMKLGRAAQAAGVLVTTAGKLPRSDVGSYDINQVFRGGKPPKILLVEHDARDLLEAGQWRDDFITLRRLNVPGAASFVVNPHRFGDVPPREKSDTCIFLMVGAARTKRRNQDMVEHAAREMIKEGHTNFEIRLIGKPGKHPIPKDLAPYVKRLGRLSFSELYQEVEAGDFILTAFQRDNPDHEFYRTTGTTGAIQLSYGFNKPCILQADFAEGTALDARSALFYGDDDDIINAMRQAVIMTRAEYQHTCDALRGASQELRRTSRKSLQNAIDT